MMTPGEKRAYQRGYHRGSRSAWPEHKPPLPPDDIVYPVMQAARRIRDEYDDFLAVLGEEDEFEKVIGPLIDQLDAAMTKYGEWLRGKVP